MKRTLLIITILASVFLVAADYEQRTTFAVLKGHTDAVYSLAFSPDGKTLASAGVEGTVQLWDTETARSRNTLKPERRSGIHSLGFSPDGRTLASGHQDGTIILWNASTGRESATLRGHDKTVRCVAFSPDDKLLASASVDQTVKLWNVRTRELWRTLAHEGLVGSVAFSPSGRELATGCDKTVRLWSVANVQEQRTFTHSETVNSIAFSPDGKRLATGSGALVFSVEGGDVSIWDLETGKRLTWIMTPMSPVLAVNHVAFLPDRKTLVFTISRSALASDSNIVLWDLEKNQETQRIMERSLSAVAVSPDGKKLASVCFAETAIKLWDLRMGK